MTKTLGDRIRELRQQKDLSLRELARKLELSAAFLSDVELGRRHPSDQVLTALSRLLGTTVEDLQSYDTRPPVQDIKRLAASDPAWGLAFRRVLDMSPEELLKIVKEQEEGRKKG